MIAQATTPLVLQQASLRFYGELLAEAEARKIRWPGKLLLMAGAGSSGKGFIAAASIMGAATLALDSDRAAVRAALREGEVDFVVNTLDEALRVLKNQLRLARPLGVALMAEMKPALEEAMERGLKPDFVVDMGLEQASNESRNFPGTRLLVDACGSSARLEDWLAAREWRPSVVTARDAVSLRRVDALLVERFGGEDLRAAWVQGIVRYQRSAGGRSRVVWLNDEECAALEREDGVEQVAVV